MGADDAKRDGFFSRKNAQNIQHGEAATRKSFDVFAQMLRPGTRELARRDANGKGKSTFSRKGHKGRKEMQMTKTTKMTKGAASTGRRAEISNGTDGRGI